MRKSPYWQQLEAEKAEARAKMSEAIEQGTLRVRQATAEELGALDAAVARRREWRGGDPAWRSDS